jgi:hypothetical protein
VLEQIGKQIFRSLTPSTDLPHYVSVVFSNPFTHPHYASVVPTHSPTIVNGVYAIIKKKIQANCCTCSHPILLDFQLSVQGKMDIVACGALKQFNKA